MKKTFTTFSFGCRVNQAEIQELNRQLISAGFSYISFARQRLAKLARTDPTFFIINTCAVTQKAEREARQFINQVRKKWPDTKIIVTGCAATKWMKERTKIQKADYLIENKDKEDIGQLIIHKSKVNPFDRLRVGHSAELSRSHAERSRSIKSQRSKVQLKSQKYLNDFLNHNVNHSPRSQKMASLYNNSYKLKYESEGIKT